MRDTKNVKHCRYGETIDKIDTHTHTHCHRAKLRLPTSIVNVAGREREGQSINVHIGVTHNLKLKYSITLSLFVLEDDDEVSPGLSSQQERTQSSRLQSSLPWQWLFWCNTLSQYFRVQKSRWDTPGAQAQWDALKWHTICIASPRGLSWSHSWVMNENVLNNRSTISIVSPLTIISKQNCSKRFSNWKHQDREETNCRAQPKARMWREVINS